MRTKYSTFLTACFCALGVSAPVYGGEPPGGYLDESKYPNIVRATYQFGSYGRTLGQMNEPTSVAIVNGNIKLTPLARDRQDKSDPLT